jgi:hypothetical protein
LAGTCQWKGLHLTGMLDVVLPKMNSDGSDGADVDAGRDQFV